jgi:hypothetical protein
MRTRQAREIVARGMSYTAETMPYNDAQLDRAVLLFTRWVDRQRGPFGEPPIRRRMLRAEGRAANLARLARKPRCWCGRVEWWGWFGPRPGHRWATTCAPLGWFTATSRRGQMPALGRCHTCRRPGGCR